MRTTKRKRHPRDDAQRKRLAYTSSILPSMPCARPSAQKLYTAEEVLQIIERLRYETTQARLAVPTYIS